jgi:antitoxin (DNA-binding transcriptional repressor) of toxin-antitoxin stability system
MRSVGMKLFRSKLDEYVRAAEAGETVLITDRDRIVAELVPPRGSLSDKDILARGTREGWLQPATVPFSEPMLEHGPVPPGEVSVSFSQLMADLAKDREDR